MTQVLTAALAERAETVPRDGDSERNREAWNLPRGTADAASHHDRGELEWADYLESYFPASSRHNLDAIAAYGAYRSSGVGSERPAAPLKAAG
jgi:hypothetical protein